MEGKLGGASGAWAQLRSMSARSNRLSADDLARWEELYPAAMQEAHDRFEYVTRRTRLQGEELVASIDFEQGYRELERVHATMPTLGTPLEVDSESVKLDGMEDAAFDVIRRAERAKAWFQTMMPLWRAEWARNGIGRSVDERESEFNRVMGGEIEALAEIDAFLAYQRVTLDRVRSCYAKISRRLETLRQLTPTGPRRSFDDE